VTKIPLARISDQLERARITAQLSGVGHNDWDLVSGLGFDEVLALIKAVIVARDYFAQSLPYRDDFDADTAQLLFRRDVLDASTSARGRHEPQTDRASQPQAERATKEASDGRPDPCVVVAAVIFGGALVTLLVVAVMPEVQHLLRSRRRGGVLDDRVFRQGGRQ
jgi:hypothetical protein